MDQLVPPKVSQEGDVTLLALGPEYEYVYENTVQQLGDIMLKTAADAEPPLVVVDLSHTKHFGSAFLALLLRLSSRIMGREGGRFAVCSLLPFCAAIIQTTKMDQVWELYDTQQEAVAALSTADGT